MSKVSSRPKRAENLSGHVWITTWTPKLRTWNYPKIYITAQIQVLYINCLS